MSGDYESYKSETWFEKKWRHLLKISVKEQDFWADC